jgi:methionine synthase I (cobalamin-dependent)/5,10-methylenetetrahydrofolate reductase
MRIPYRERLTKGVILFDGAMGTMLYHRGVFFNRCFEETVLSRGDVVRAIHADYVAAGAEAIETNTFGANPLKLARHGLESQMEAINRQACALAREAAGDDVYVAGSVGPLGVHIEPFGTLTRAQAEDAFRVHFSALLSGGVDLILLETFKSVEELLLAARVCRALDAGIPIQAQFTVGQDGLTEEGMAPEKAGALLQAEAATDVIGINCSIGSAHSLDVLLKLRDCVAKPLVVMPNAGFPKEVEGRSFYLSSPEYMAEYARQFLEAGATVIGGCCGTTPDHIREMARALKAFDGGRRSVKVKPIKDETALKPEKPLASRSRLGKALADGEWITAVELVPPQGTDLTGTIERAEGLKKAGVTVINIPDGPRASARLSSLITALEIQRRAGIEALLHYACRDRNLIGMQSDLLGAHAVGLANLLLVTGDPPKLGGYPDASGVFDVDAVGLTLLASRLNCSLDIGGNALPAGTAFVKGVGANPLATALDREVERVFKKAEAGADFIITQPVFDSDSLLSFIKKIEKTKLPVVTGIWPLASYRNALFLKNEVPGVVIPDRVLERMEKCAGKDEAQAEGVRLAREIVREVRGAVAGVQVSPPFGRIKTALAVIADSDEQAAALLAEKA